MEPIIDTQQFLALSSFLHYQLAAEPVNWRGILNLVLEKPPEPAREQGLAAALEYLGAAYGDQKRRLGPLAILHPLRTAALLARAGQETARLDLLTALLHDKGEDLTPAADGDLEHRFQRLLEEIGREEGARLNERVAILAKAPGETYTGYLGRLLEKAKQIPPLATVKLADRLDNTFDLRIDLHDFTDRSRAFQVIFDILFANGYGGIPLTQPHPIARKINGAMRLYQLYKNAVFLSLLRTEKIPLGETTGRLAHSLAVASIREAQSIMLHIFAYHLRQPAAQRTLLLEAMEYAQAGGLEEVRTQGTASLDGLFRTYFVHASQADKKKNLETLYQDKHLMGLAAVAFLAVFANFMNDPAYAIRGISRHGLQPQH